MVIDNFNDKSGFSMVEMLVAIAMVGIAIPPLMGAYVQATQASLAARNQATAVNAAEWKLADVIATNSYSELDGFSDSGEFSDDDGAFDGYQYEVSSSSVSGNLSNFESIKLEICVFYEDVHSGSTRTINQTNTSSCDVPDFVHYVSRTDLNES